MERIEADKQLPPVLSPTPQQPEWRHLGKRTILPGLVIFASLAAPLWYAYANGFKDSMQLVYLFLLLSVATTGYCAMLWNYWERTCRRKPGSSFDNVVRPHLLPLCVLVTITNLALGFSSYLDKSSMSASCGKAVLCFGVTPLGAFPGVTIPTGVVLLALWGSFFYNCYQILQRIVNDDVPRSVWIYSAFRTGAALLAAMFVFAIIFAAELKADITNNVMHVADDKQTWAGLAMFFSFLVGFFPLITIRQLARFALDRLSQSTQWLGKYTYTPLTVIDGITNSVQDRLEEAGIDSIHLLACADVDDLKNPDGKALPYTREILNDWIDQAQLALYFADERELAAIRGIGVRTFSALLAFQKAAKRAEEEGKPWDWTAIEAPRDSPIITAQRFKAFVLYGQFQAPPAIDSRT